MTNDEIELDEAIRAFAKAVVKERVDARQSTGDIRSYQATAATEAFGTGSEA